ncbi:MULTISPECIES: hypothetical protein [unclassified Novosphingobium]|uniref:hypothetical protein n=1 Tax=unclassified Novosphingobium TaxID=2644732 RepID=UPI000D30ED26|nr:MULTISPECIES: hypothetical protein [unclassified Novosphingobium]PTR06401.1 hypothetical protein C8K11_12014 [Novosphingobium sp. GV055]PUA94820.1 hypothetical protein C8K12_12014 [Novosphingobium sp. GV061]PUB13745.1 hypothetical protein C8K14_12014 [Novosphingobium sp. GV079]PUB38443.1 hypothetical protein C8K10_12014 [Novosphingobium sp. GV027]
MRPVPMTAAYRAWKLHNGVHYPLRPEASTLTNVVAEAQQSCAHKDQFAVLECAGGKQVLRIYQIKQGKDMWVRKPGFSHSVKVPQLRADLIAELAVENYEPVEAWQWTPGADAVGAPAREIVL